MISEPLCSLLKYELVQNLLKILLSLNIDMQMIKIVCDVHISFKIVRFLESKNVKAVHVNDILDGDITKDNKIAEFVDENNYILMTKDADFQNSHFLNKSPKKLIQN
jgi:predicted nuclease of predicted toxin-antitoxin system